MTLGGHQSQSSDAFLALQGGQCLPHHNLSGALGCKGPQSEPSHKQLKRGTRTRGALLGIVVSWPTRRQVSRKLRQSGANARQHAELHTHLTDE